MHINMEVFLMVFAVIATNLGTILTLYFQNDRKLEEHRKESSDILRGMQVENSDILRGIQAEMKDFHGRLERQDAEFKAFLMHKADKQC